MQENIKMEVDEYTPNSKYEAVLIWVYKRKKLYLCMRLISYLIVAFSALSFILRLIYLLPDAYLRAVELLVITGVPFVIVSVMRKLINAPRPYELLHVYSDKPKSKAGQSFPSRHVFSAFIIAVVLIPWNVAVGVVLLFLGVLLAVIRVLLGIHFVRDVVAGALIGAASGLLGLLITHLI